MSDIDNWLEQAYEDRYGYPEDDPDLHDPDDTCDDSDTDY